VKKLVEAIVLSMTFGVWGCGSGDGGKEQTLDAAMDAVVADVAAGGDAGAADGGSSSDAAATTDVSATAGSGGGGAGGGAGGTGGAMGTGDLDPTFRVSAPADVQTVALEPSGKVLIGGAFNIFNGEGRDRVARLLENGELDPGFKSSGAVTNNIITTVLPLPDGKVIVGGNTNSAHVRRVGRLGADGSVDMGWNGGATAENAGANGSVVKAVRQPDGKIVIGGWFGGYAGQARGGVARLNEDGTVDPSFTTPGGGIRHSGIAQTPYVSALALQADGKILIGGYFDSYGGVRRRFVARLEANGALDGSFDPGMGGDNTQPTVRDIAALPDGKILIGGHFTNYNGKGQHYLVRLNTDGSLDETFKSPFMTDGAIRYVIALLVQPDGKIWVGGTFVKANLPGRDYLARLTADGTLDTYDPGVGHMFGWTFGFARQPDGKIIAVSNQGVLRLKNGAGQ
jgi:uncharacterized delta-60 repeat protein